MEEPTRTDAPALTWSFLALGAALLVIAVSIALAVRGGDAPEPSASPSKNPFAAPTASAHAPASSELPHVTAGVDSPGHDDWLHTDGNRIVDASGNEVWITGANWYGFNMQARVLGGLWAANMEDTLTKLGMRGINTIRLPISAQLLLEWRDYGGDVPRAVDYTKNPDLAGRTSLEIFDAFLAAAKDRGMKIIPDIHAAEADDDGHMTELWYTDRVSADQVVEAWEWFAERYKDDDTIIGYDLKNEPHGAAVWDDSDAQENWRAFAERLGNRLLEINPHALILVEGVDHSPTPDGGVSYTWWGGDLRQAAAHPIRLSDPTKLVYSPHEYGPLVYEQPWFQKAFTGETLRADVWQPNWLYLHEDGTAPLFIGEWGGHVGRDGRQDAWMLALRDLIVRERIAHTWWCVNPESGDTGGLFGADWQTFDEKKWDVLTPALWQDGAGHFVSLDHATPLPGGASVRDVY